MKKLIKQLLPHSLSQFIRLRNQNKQLSRLDRIKLNVSHLSSSFNDHSLKEVFVSREITAEWPQVEQEVSSFSLAETAGGVNVGDRRAIYYLLRHLRPRSVLEVGTHIGASSVHAVAALRKTREQGGPGARFTTVDICNVNDPKTKPWLSWGSKWSPREMIHKMGAAEWVQFITKPSLEFLSATGEGFDFIFLDGDHCAKTVYQEIPAALDHLNPNGVILLHDYFPNAKPLWKGEPLFWGLGWRGNAFNLRVPSSRFYPWENSLGLRN